MPTQHEPLVEPGRLIINIPVPMRDGVNLSADIWLPDSSQGDGPWPTLLLRTIYDNQEPRYIGWARRFTAQGYAVVMEDCRGRGDSEGEREPYVCELHDGYDTHEWIGRQPWCDGNVGTFGLSYPGFTQTLPASLRSKYLKAVAPIALCEGIVRARFRNGTDNPELMTPGQIYRFEIDMWDTSNLFQEGHRIRVEISSSNFPRYNRNLNSGNRLESDTEITIANQTIYHDAGQPTHVTLPVLPTSHVPLGGCGA